jgi:peptidoglycan/LPS O-acetylase OafA/YrhL
MQNRFIAIDILRVIAICFVIMVRHIDDYASEMFQCRLVIDLTIISLGILVYISGYLLVTTNPIFNSITDIKNFIIKRILRIYPLYALALLAFYFLSIINGQKLISGLLLYNLYIGEYILTLWFIPMIIIFYLVFVLLNYNYNLKKFLYISIFIFLLLLIERIIFKKFDGVLILYFPSFICGILSARYSNYLKLTINTSIFTIVIFLIILFLKDFAPSKLSIMICTIMIVSFSLPSMFLLSKIKKNTIITGFIINVSYASFCMYLTHRIMFNIVLLIYKPRTDIITLIYLYLVVIPFIYIVSFYTQKFYDKLLKYGTLVSNRHLIS